MKEINSIDYVIETCDLASVTGGNSVWSSWVRNYIRRTEPGEISFLGTKYKTVPAGEGDRTFEGAFTSTLDGTAKTHTFSGFVNTLIKPHYGSVVVK
jgi:hypothetical protein